MIMDEMEGGIRYHGRSKNIQCSQCGLLEEMKLVVTLPIDILQSGRHMSRPLSPATNRRTQTSRDALQSTTFSTSYDPKDNNRRIQTSRDALQSAKFSTSYDLRDNTRRTQTSRDILQSVIFSTSYDPRDNNIITNGRRE
jgi:hypothetical protein